MKQNKQFEEWLINSHYVEYKSQDDNELWMFYAGDNVCAETWSGLKWVFKWGVYLEFFDSVHIVIHQTAFDRFEFITVDVAFNFYSKSTNRTKAQIEGIEKAFKVLEG